MGWEVGGGFKREGTCVHTYGWSMLLFGRDQQNAIILQLKINKLRKKTLQDVHYGYLRKILIKQFSKKISRYSTLAIRTRKLTKGLVSQSLNNRIIVFVFVFVFQIGEWSYICSGTCMLSWIKSAAESIDVQELWDAWRRGGKKKAVTYSR